MVNINYKKAFSSIEFLITLFLLSILLVAFCMIIKISDLNFSRNKNMKEKKDAVDLVFNVIIDELKNDKTSEIDSKNDSVWNFDGKVIDGYNVNLKSLSGLIDLNFLSMDFIKKSNLISFFDKQENIYKYEEMKRSGELFYSYNEINDFISKDVFNKYFTFYSFPNFNIIDINVLKKFSSDYVSDYFANELINMRKSITINRQFIQTESEYRVLLGIYFDEIHPYININAPINVNFIDKDLLKTIVSYPDFNISEVSQKVNTLVSQRDVGEVSQEDIINIFNISKNNELYYYLGCKTWFWEINIFDSYIYCRYIVARSVDNDISGKPEFYLIEKKWL